MFKKYSAVFILLLIFSIISCQKRQENFDVIKNFKPEDKYFKANIVNLHFVIETSTKEKINEMFDRIITRYELPITASGCKDGEYIGESPYDAFDYKHIVKIKIEDERIVSIDYDEINKNGIGKQKDEEYCKEMSQSGTTPAKAYPIMEKQLIEKQDILKVDAVTGATSSLYRFRYALIIALIKAHLTE